MTALNGTPEDFDVNRYTATASRAYVRNKSNVRDLLLDLYNALLGIAVVVALAGSTLYALRKQLVAAAAAEQQALIDERWSVISPAAFLAAAGLAGLLALTVLARKMGPVSVSRAESQWWLSLPVDRRPLVVGRLLRKLSALMVGAAAIYASISMLVLIDGPIAGHMGGALAFGLLAGAAALLAAVRQLHQDSTNRHMPILVSAGLGIASFLPSLAASGRIWPVIVALALTVGIWSYVSPRLGAIPGAELTRGGAVSGHAGGALFFMDINEFTRAFEGSQKELSADHGRRAGRLFDLRPHGAAGALLQADVVAFLRVPGWWVKPVLWLICAVAVLLLETALPVVLQLALVLVAGCAVSSSVGGVARQTAISGVDRMLPLGNVAVKSIRMVMPAMVLMVWMGMLASFFVLLVGADGTLLILATLAGVGMAAGTLRAAYRPVPDWSQPPVETPFGPMPNAQLSGFARGIDAAAISLFPVLLAIHLGHVPPSLFYLQLVASGGAWAAAVFTNTGNK